MKTMLNLLLLLSLMGCVLTNDACNQITSTPLGCSKNASKAVAVKLDTMRSCSPPSITWGYPCGTLNVTFTSSQANFKVCVTGGLGFEMAITKMATSPRCGVIVNVPIPTTAKPSCVTSTTATKSINMAFLADRSMQTYMAGIDFTIKWT